MEITLALMLVISFFVIALTACVVSLVLTPQVKRTALRNAGIDLDYSLVVDEHEGEQDLDEISLDAEIAEAERRAEPQWDSIGNGSRRSKSDWLIDELDALDQAHADRLAAEHEASTACVECGTEDVGRFVSSVSVTVCRDCFDDIPF